MERLISVRWFGYAYEPALTYSGTVTNAIWSALHRSWRLLRDGGLHARASRGEPMEHCKLQFWWICL